MPSFHSVYHTTHLGTSLSWPNSNFSLSCKEPSVINILLFCLSLTRCAFCNFNLNTQEDLNPVRVSKLLEVWKNFHATWYKYHYIKFRTNFLNMNLKPSPLKLNLT
jgi:hypothetical protein